MGKYNSHGFEYKHKWNFDCWGIFSM